jgi:hypothetical protein
MSLYVTSSPEVKHVPRYRPSTSPDLRALLAAGLVRAGTLPSVVMAAALTGLPTATIYQAVLGADRRDIFKAVIRGELPLYLAAKQLRPTAKLTRPYDAANASAHADLGRIVGAEALFVAAIISALNNAPAH